MTTETETYANERDWRDALTRASTRHINGWRAKSNSKTKLSITWNNDVTPDPKQTEKDRLKVLQDKILVDSITERELVEYERLKIQLRL